MGNKVTTRIIGIGNPMAGDDGIGVLTARRLKPLCGRDVEVLEVPHAGLELLDVLAQVEFVIVIDAVVSGQRPGTIHRIDLSGRAMAVTGSPSSSHGFSFPAVVELARGLGAFPPRLVLYGIELARATPGTRVSPAVRAAVPRVVHRIEREVRAASHA